MTVEGNVLVGVRGFAVDIKVERAITIADDIDIQHGNVTIFLDLFRPFDVWVNGIEVSVKWLYVVIANGCESIVGFPEPEEDYLVGADGVVPSRVIG